MRFSLVSVLLVAALAACGEEFDAGQYDVTGRWTGTALADSVQLELRLEQDEEDISGSGTLSAGGRTVPVEVRGDFAFPSVDLRLRGEGFAPVLLDGAFEDDTTRVSPTDTTRVIRASRLRIRGTLTGSALDGGTFRILRDTAR
jgi:hypothetical protein